jgi:hypothetical protein
MEKILEFLAKQYLKTNSIAPTTADLISLLEVCQQESSYSQAVQSKILDIQKPVSVIQQVGSNAIAKFKTIIVNGKKVQVPIQGGTTTTATSKVVDKGSTSGSVAIIDIIKGATGDTLLLSDLAKWLVDSPKTMELPFSDFVLTSDIVLFTQGSLTCFGITTKPIVNETLEVFVWISKPQVLSIPFSSVTKVYRLLQEP